MNTPSGKFRKPIAECPFCGAELKQNESSCFCCGRALKKSKTLTTTPNPLWLPRGAIRAAITVAIAISSWTLIIQGKEIPEYLFGLLLAIAGYYFSLQRNGSQSQETENNVRFHGLAFAIRIFLLAGFLACAPICFRSATQVKIHYIEFYGIFAGFVIGYIFARLFSLAKGSATYNCINHIKGASALLAALLLAALVMTGNTQLILVSLFFSALISFYFGSKS